MSRGEPLLIPAGKALAIDDALDFEDALSSAHEAEARLVSKLPSCLEMYHHTFIDCSETCGTLSALRRRTGVKPEYKGKGRRGPHTKGSSVAKR